MKVILTIFSLLAVFGTLSLAVPPGLKPSGLTPTPTIPDCGTSYALAKRNPCDGVDAMPEVKKFYYADSCPPKYTMNADGSCDQWWWAGTRGEECARYCQVKTYFDYGREKPFLDPWCRGPFTCSMTNSSSVSTQSNYIDTWSLKVQLLKALKIGVSGSFGRTESYGWGKDYSVHLEKGQCGYFTFVPIQKTVCGTMTEASWHPTRTGLCENGRSTPNFCRPEAWEPYGPGRNDGEVVFVWTDCATRKPLPADQQDPVFNEPNVALPREALMSIMKETQTKNTCEADIFEFTGIETGESHGLFSITGSFFDPDKFDNGDGLKRELGNCRLNQDSWAFTFTPDNATQEWAAGGLIDNPSGNWKDCVGNAVISAGGATKGQCVG